MPTPTAEIVALRGLSRKVFETDEPGVRIARCHGRPVHYTKPDGSFDDRGNMVQPASGGWAIDSLGARVAIENGWLTITRWGRVLRMRPTSIGMVDRTAPASRWQKLADASYVDVTRDGQTVTVHDVFPQTDLTVTLDEWGFRKAFTIRQRPNVPDPVALGWDPSKTFIVVVWDVQLPSGVVVKDAVTDEVVGLGYVGNNDLVLEHDGSEVFRFLRGTASTAKHSGHPVWYVVAPNVPFGEAFSYEKWSLATFPVVIDPTTQVYAPTSTDDGTVFYQFGPDGAFATTNQTILYAGESTYEDQTDKSMYAVRYRAFVRFDLSGLAGTCTLAELKMYASYVNFIGTTLRDFPLYLHSSDWGTLDDGDWSAAASLQSTLQLNNAAGVGYKTWGCDEAAIQSRFGGVAAFRLQGPEGLGVMYCEFYSNDSPYPQYDPYLEITYSSGTPALTAKLIRTA